MQTSSGWLTLSGGLKILEKDSAQPAGLPTLYGGEPVSAEPGEQLTFAAQGRQHPGQHPGQRRRQQRLRYC